MKSENFIQQNGVYISTDTVPDERFEKLYLGVRQKEERVYSNEVLGKLPRINRKHPHFREWQIRKASCKKLIAYLNAKKRPLHILEIGCGNGWLSHQLTKVPQSEIVGIDINMGELQQAACIFLKSNLSFVYGDIRQNVLQPYRFDVIVFPASVQYFSSISEIINLTLKLLNAGGEIHIIDSFFYTDLEVEARRKRSKTYFECMGFPEMINYFFHFSLNELKNFNYIILQQRNSFVKRLFTGINLFPWICIRQN